MRGLTRDERRALTVDPNAPDEWLHESVFDALVRDGRGRWFDPDGEGERFFATELGELAMRVCPIL